MPIDLCIRPTVFVIGRVLSLFESMKNFTINTWNEFPWRKINEKKLKAKIPCSNNSNRTRNEKNVRPSAENVCWLATSYKMLTTTAECCRWRSKNMGAHVCVCCVKPTISFCSRFCNSQRNYLLDWWLINSNHFGWLGITVVVWTILLLVDSTKTFIRYAFNKIH